MAGPLRAPLPALRALALALALALAVRGGALAAGPAQSPRLVGGPLEADGDAEDVRRMLDFAVREYNQMSNDRFLHRPVALVRARKQVVSGMNYFLEVEIGRTKCTKSQALSSGWSNCPFHDSPGLKKKTLCLFQVYTVPWLNTTSLVKSNCHNA
ncbi:cystatin-C-like [Suncus etruscus]|uniref:cystatin-C-like n=1 Tax=Suncus etruscus TaxID=109475 RepID=UPI00211088E7|nr:cystatin-C-like [Suncus etruscus]